MFYFADAAKVVGMPKVVYGGLTRLVRILCPTVAVPPVNGVDWIKDGKKIYPVNLFCFFVEVKLKFLTQTWILQCNKVTSIMNL